MLPDRVSNPGPLTYESGALSIALCGPAQADKPWYNNNISLPTSNEGEDVCHQLLIVATDSSVLIPTSCQNPFVL